MTPCVTIKYHKFIVYSDIGVLSSNHRKTVCRDVSALQRERTIEVDLAVAVLVSLVDHVDDLLVRQVVAQVHQHVLQLVGVDRARAVAVKH